MEALSPGEPNLLWLIQKSKHRTIGQRANRADEASLSTSGNAAEVQRSVDIIGARFLALADPVRTTLGCSEGLERFLSAFFAWPMTSCERDCFVEKEQLGISARSHQLTFATLEREQARHPAFMLPARGAKLSD